MKQVNKNPDEETPGRRAGPKILMNKTNIAGRSWSLFFGTMIICTLFTINKMPAVSKANAITERQGIEQHTRSVLQNTNEFWQARFASFDSKYRPPKIVFFQGETITECGNGIKATGPFYCNLDETIYIDIDFFKILETKYGTAGNTTQAFVVAHEVGHHIQNIIGITRKFFRMTRRSLGPSRHLYVRLELQADCYAGYWMGGALKAGWLKKDQLQKGLDAAARIGDDLIEIKGKGRQLREVFSHGKSAQRARWFAIGTKATDINQCNTFNTRLR